MNAWRNIVPRPVAGAMRLHLLGVCGMFMAGLARLAALRGHKVEGSDVSFHEPMAAQLDDAGIVCHHGYNATCANRPADLYIIGNALSRGCPLLESVLAERRPLCSAPDWMASELLSRAGRIAAVAGTHGKTTTASMLVHMLENCGMKPSYLVGGVHSMSGKSADLGGGDTFVIEADEYDSAFFDKRPKFASYWCDVAVLTNIEFDHADIYRNLREVELQFSRLPRQLRPGGVLVANGADRRARRVVDGARWCESVFFNSRDGLSWGRGGVLLGQVGRLGDGFALPAGRHNRCNALAAATAAALLGADPVAALRSLAGFRLPERRLQEVANGGGVTVVDDFAHHPTALAAALQGAAERYPKRRLVVVVELRSNTMRSGCWRGRLAGSLTRAGRVFASRSGATWDLRAELGSAAVVRDQPMQLADPVLSCLRDGDVVVMCSNGDFGGLRGHIARQVAKIG